jgi:cytoskeleton protein RodZ
MNHFPEPVRSVADTNAQQTVLDAEVQRYIAENQLCLPFAADSIPMNLPTENAPDTLDADAVPLAKQLPAMPAIPAAAAQELGGDLAPPGEGEPITLPSVHESLGQRMRSAREMRAWSIEEAAAKLHLPVARVHALESDAYEGIAHRVYLRGYLSSYVRLLDLPQVLVERALSEPAEAPALVATGAVSHSRYLIDRYSVPAVYVILTGLVVMPAVWLATHGGLEQNFARISALDNSTGGEQRSEQSVGLPTEASLAPPSPAQSTDGTRSASFSTDQLAAKPANSDAPLIASLSPFPITHPSSTEAPASGSSPASRAGVGAAHHFHLRLNEASWVEVVGADGKHLEYALLAAGSTRDYHSEQWIDVRIGNASGAEVVIDGKPVDISAYRHANVARFKAFAGSVPISRSE